MKNKKDFPNGTFHKSQLSQVAAEAEKKHIIKVLKSTQGNKTKAAEVLGISRKTLWEKVREYNIEI
jgi:two-component system response regulator AtoC